MDFDGLNLFIALALLLGHGALHVAVINRVHAWPLPEAVLHRFRQLHDLLIIVCPAMFLWCYGFHGPRLAFGGSWHLVPLPILAYLVVCGTVAAAVPVMAVNRLLHRPPRLQLSNHTQNVDISRRLGFRP